MKTCSICNSTKDADPNEFASDCDIREIMEERDCCFDCAFWIEKINMELDHRIRIVTNGKHMLAYPWDSGKGSYFRGFCGHDFYFKMNTGEYIRSNNVWFQGVIPERWRKDLPDNCTPITKEEYELADSI